MTEWYRGGPADQVTVGAPPDGMQALVQAADFQIGQRYLVSANDGFVTVCGFTAPYSDDLAALYAEAFGSWALAWSDDRRRAPPRRRRRQPDGPTQGPRRR